jgi:Tfp pilus assembly protein PilW
MRNSGIALIELLVYMGILVVVTLFITLMLINLFRTWGQARASRAVDNAGEIAMERIVREIRMADSIVSSTNNTLKVRAFRFSDPTLPQTDHRSFFLGATPNDDILFMKDTTGHDSSPNGTALTPSSVSVTNLMFAKIDKPGLSAESVLVEFTIMCKECTQSVSRTFRTLANLRGSY